MHNKKPNLTPSTAPDPPIQNQIFYRQSMAYLYKEGLAGKKIQPPLQMASPVTPMAISSIRQPYPADKRGAFSRRGAADKLWRSTDSVAENHDEKVTCARPSTVRITSLFSTLGVSHLIGASPPWLGGAGHGRRISWRPGRGSVVLGPVE